MKLGGRSFMMVAGLVFGAAVVHAQVESKIDGVFYGDYYFNVKNHDADQEDLNAFSIRRVYFTFESTISKDIKTRFRLESAHGDFGSTSKITPFVKHAYLEWSNLVPNHKLYIGIAETNAFKNTEDLWGYRSIEKTAMDLNKISSSADMGVALKGDLSLKVHHWLTLMNGTGYGSAEVDKYKKIGYAFWVTPVNSLILEGYADYEKQDPDHTVLKTARNYTGSKGYYTLKALAGYRGRRIDAGVEVFRQTNQQSGITNVQITNGAIVSSEKTDVTKQGYSVFGSFITSIPKLKVFGRFDWFDPNSGDDVATAFSDGLLKTGKKDESTLIIAGLDYIPVGNVHFMPNVLIKSYAQPGVDSDVTARLTCYYKFNSGKIIVE